MLSKTMRAVLVHLDRWGSYENAYAEIGGVIDTPDSLLVRAVDRSLDAAIRRGYAIKTDSDYALTDAGRAAIR